MAMQITRVGSALGATVEGLDVDALTPEIEQQLVEAWHEHLVLFFPGINLSPAQQLRLARVFGPRLAATTETNDDHRRAPSLAAEGFPEILLLDTDHGHDPRVTSNWHTDVTFTERPPIGSLFVMEIAAERGGDTMFSNQYMALDGLSEPTRDYIRGLHGVHGRPPRTEVSEHPMVLTHPGTGRDCLFVNRGWTAGVAGVSPVEGRHLLAMLAEHSERHEYQFRWTWTSGDAALWDNRCTMHYAVNDYAGQRRRARRATIYADALSPG
jgi:taurine dioxygenase